MPSLEDLLRDAMSLPPSDRAALAGALLGSLDEAPGDDDVENLWSAEIAQRVAAIDASRVQLVPWSVVRQRMSDE